MSTPPQMGKYHFNQALNEARQANRETRGLLKRLIDASPSHLITALAGRIAIEVSENDSALNKLDEIGKNSKAKRIAQK